MLSVKAEYEVNANAIMKEPTKPPATSRHNGTRRFKIIAVQYKRRQSKSQFNSQMISTYTVKPSTPFEGKGAELRIIYITFKLGEHLMYPRAFSGACLCLGSRRLHSSTSFFHNHVDHLVDGLSFLKRV